MIDWTRSLLPASFNGQVFYVQSGEIEAGHRVNTTPIPNGRHINESFGPAARKFTVEAYLTGDACYTRAAALIAAAEGQHRGLLILPDSGPHPVRLTKATRKFDKDKLGYAVVSLEAVGEPVAAATGLSALALEQQIYGVGALATAATGTFAAGGFALAGQPSMVIEAALEQAAQALGDLTALASAARLDPAGRDALAPKTEAALAALAGFASAPASYGAALAEVAIALGDVADPATLTEIIDALGPPAEPPAALVLQGAALVIAGNGAAGVALAAAMRALALGEALARRSFRDRPEAVAARMIAAAVFDDALARLGRSALDLAGRLSAMRGLVAERISRVEADLAPVVRVAAPLRLPSLVWAWRLYGAPARADELARRAGVAHPGFMPESFEALAA